MLGGRQTIFLTPYFQFEKRFDFLFVYVMNTCDYFLFCLPGIMENGVYCHGILLSDFSENPAPFHVKVYESWLRTHHLQTTDNVISSIDY